MTRNGIATNASAITTPAVVNGRVIPNQSSRDFPTMPLRPRAISRATPPTTGGRTRGRVTRARTSPRPGNSTRASSQASGTPMTRLTAVAAVAQTSDSWSACHTSALVSSSGRLRQGARTSRAISGTTRNARPSNAGTRRGSGTAPLPPFRTRRRRGPPRRELVAAPDPSDFVTA